MTTFTPDLPMGEAPDPAQHLSRVDWSETQILLYQRIMEFDIDGGPVDFTFTKRLARENGWTIAYTNRVIHEYKCFIFLIVHAGHPVTPSDQVDQAWHLHLTYTDSYWDRLCNNIVGRPLHHTPTRGGSEEARKFDAWYGYTLKSYQRFFGTLPPIFIWPDASTRFGDDFFFQRVNTRRHWIVPKPPWIVSFFTLSVGLGSLLFGVTFVIPDNETLNNIFVCLIFTVIAVMFVLGVLNEHICVKCRRYNALKKTGVVETRNNNAEWEEYRCSYCDFQDWRKRAAGGGADGGGADGCGGCGGCGG